MVSTFNLANAYFGLATDTKPTGCANGSVLLEYNVSTEEWKKYVFDAENSAWRELTI